MRRRDAASDELLALDTARLRRALDNQPEPMLRRATAVVNGVSRAIAHHNKPCRAQLPRRTPERELRQVDHRHRLALTLDYPATHTGRLGSPWWASTPVLQQSQPR